MGSGSFSLQLCTIPNDTIRLVFPTCVQVYSNYSCCNYCGTPCIGALSVLPYVVLIRSPLSGTATSYTVLVSYCCITNRVERSKLQSIICFGFTGVQILKADVTSDSLRTSLPSCDC